MATGRMVLMGAGGGYTAAPLWLRTLTGLLDAGVEGVLAAGACALWFDAYPPALPPRWWNAFDYGVDLVNARPEVVLVPVIAFAGTFIVWETLFGALLGAAPIARIAGLRACSTTGRRPGPVRMFVRAVLALITTMTALAGPATAIASPKRRMLHDILTGCVVLLGDVPESWAQAREPDSEAGLSTAPRMFLDGPRR